MAIKDSNTEKQIIAAARQLFFKEGRFKATTQEIANAAGVNRTLVNYYFRSRDVLFEKILKEANDSIDARMLTVIDASTSFREKVEHLIDVFIEQSVNYPYLDVYIVTRMNDDAALVKDVIKESDFRRQQGRVKDFLHDIETEMAKGTIQADSPLDFFLNLMALLSYPAAVQPMMKRLLQMNNKQYSQVLANRKQVIMKTLFP